MNGFGYYSGMMRQQAVILQSRHQDRKEARRRRAAAKKAAKPVSPENKLRYRIKVSVGHEKGEEVFVTLRLSLNQLKEAARQVITGNGSYHETVRRVEQFKDGILLPNE